jgi:hypothetical protein
MKFSSNKTPSKNPTPVTPVAPSSVEEERAPVTERQPEPVPEPMPEPSQAEQLRDTHARAAATSGGSFERLAHEIWLEHVEPALIRLASDGGQITAIRWNPGSLHTPPNPQTLEALVALSREKGFRAQLDSMGALLVDFGP